jgi:uncharacterized damage-inducible protein DinB
LATVRTFQPEQATFLLQGMLLPAVKNEHALTKRVIEAIPPEVTPEKGDYRPDPCAKSALELAWHIVSAEHRFHDAVAAGEFNLTPAPRPKNLGNSADIAKWYAESFEQDFELLTKLSGEQLSKIVDFRGLFQLPAVLFVQIGLNHTIHHRGQLSTYLRPMGGKVPAIYGESYDSAEARKSAQAAR